MCGIFGVALVGNNKLQEHEINTARNVISKLALLNQSRGKHSTGIARIGIDGKVSIYKKPNAAIHLVFQAKWKTASTLSEENRIIMGHTRWATHGEVNEKNAHPFHINNFVGTHNGVICYFGKYKEESLAYDVDSQNFFFLASKYGIDNVIDEISGSCTTAIFDTTNPTNLTFTKVGNPLTIIKINNKLVFWSSEEEHLKDAIKFSYSSNRIEKISLDTSCRVDLDIISGSISEKKYQISRFISHGYSDISGYSHMSGRHRCYSSFREYDSYESELFDRDSGDDENENRKKLDYSDSVALVGPHRNVKDLFKGIKGEFHPVKSGDRVVIVDADRAIINIDGVWKKIRPVNITGVVVRSKDVHRYLEFLQKNFNVSALRELGDIYFPEENLLSEIDPKNICLLKDYAFYRLSPEDKERYVKVMSSKLTCDSCFGEFAPQVEKFIIPMAYVSNRKSMSDFDSGLLICPICNMYALLNKTVLMGA